MPVNRPSKRIDPTGLFTLRKKVSSRIRGLVQEFGRDLQQYLETELIPSIQQQQPSEEKIVVSNASFFSRMIDGLKVWTNNKLEAMLKKALDSKTFGDWWAEALRVSYSRGIVSAYSDLNALKRVVSPIPFATLSSEFAKSFAVKKMAENSLPLLLSAAAEELGLTTSRSVTSLLRQAGTLLGQQASARQMASELVEAALKGLGANTTRVMQTEMTRAYNWGKLDGARTLGVTHITIYAEIHGIDDNRRCIICRDLDGTIWPIEQAYSMLPVHPACRCSVRIVSADRVERQERIRQSLLESVLSSVSQE